MSQVEYKKEKRENPSLTYISLMLFMFAKKGRENKQKVIL